jgi:hypothetical protein
MMQDAGDSGAKHKLSKHKLDAMGYVKSHSGIMNDDQRVKRLKNQAQLAESIAEIKCFENAAKEKKQGDMHVVQSQLAPAGVLKLVDRGGDVAKLTVKEILSILFACCYSIDMPPNKSGAKKPEYVKALEGAIQIKGRDLLSSAVALLEVTRMDQSDAEDGGDDEPAPARMHFNEDD